jgi:thiol:disulfide interchange protein
MIKQRIFTLLLVLYISSSHANEGISFFKGSWSELLAAAKQQGKFIFVDVYTDWCPP